MIFRCNIGRKAQRKFQFFGIKLFVEFIKTFIRFLNSPIKGRDVRIPDITDHIHVFVRLYKVTETDIFSQKTKII